MLPVGGALKRVRITSIQCRIRLTRFLHRRRYRSGPTGAGSRTPTPPMIRSRLPSQIKIPEPTDGYAWRSNREFVYDPMGRFGYAIPDTSSVVGRRRYRKYPLPKELDAKRSDCCGYHGVKVTLMIPVKE